jgi:ubiquitin C-terminal hydrolase
MIDLSKYTDLPSAQYRIKSYIVHEGSSLHAGHYRAYVTYNGEYFCCDDQNKNSFAKITEDEFYERRDAYLLFMEKI